MANIRNHLTLASILWMMPLASVATAQDPESGEVAVSGGARTSYSGGGASSGTTGISLEMQGRIDAFTTAGLESTSLGSGNGGVSLTLPAVPFMTAGVRLLDDNLFLGVGLGFASVKTKVEPPAGPETETKRTAFMLAPVVTYDLLRRGMIALYPLGMLKIGKVGGGDNSPGADSEGAFWWGLNLGLGLRANLTDNIAAMTEFGWGFERGTWEDNNTDHTVFGQGLFGTLGLALNIGL